MKKITVMLFSISLVFCLVSGCGSGNKSGSTLSNGLKASNVTKSCNIQIEKKTYNLADDPHKVIGQMVTDGLYVLNPSTVNHNYGEDGYFETDSEKRLKINEIVDHPCVYFASSELGGVTKLNTYVSFYYYEICRISTKFKTGDGIQNSSTLSDVKQLKGYLPYIGFPKLNDFGVVSVYFDNQQVDLDKYAQDKDTFLKWYEENASLSMDDPNKKPTGFGVNYISGAMPDQVPDILNNYESTNPGFTDTSIKLTYALQDGYQMIKDGKIQRMYAVWYIYSKENKQSFYKIYVYGDEVFYHNKEQEEQAKANQ